MADRHSLLSHLRLSYQFLPGMDCLRTAVSVLGGVLTVLVFTHTAAAQEGEWRAVEQMSYDQMVHEQQAPGPYRDCGLRKSDMDVFVERYPDQAQARGPANQTATLEVAYSGGFPDDAQAAFQRAVDIWETHISSPVTIRIQANWQSLEPNVLGGAGPYTVFLSEGENTIYGAPLADALSGTDQSPEEPDIFAQFNSSRTDWHFGEGDAPPGTIDFTSVVLHEIAHGLNYIDFFNYNSGTGGYGLDFNGDGQIDGEERAAGAFGRLLVEDPPGDASISLTNENQFANPSEALGDALTSEQLFFDGDRSSRGAQQGDGPVPPKIYAPSFFQAGSSIAHLAESTYPPESENALMTPQIGTAETNRDPGPIVCGQMQDMGWTLGTGCQQFFRDVFALELQAANTTDDSRTLSWNVGSTANIDEYFVDQMYFDGEFETVREIDASSLSEPSVTLDSLGLGVFSFRLRWVRSDGSQGTSLETVQDTINVGNVATEVSGRDEQGRGTVSFSWTEPSGTRPSVRYRVERRLGTSGSFQPVTTTDQTSYTAEQQTPGRYQYRVRSEDGQGNSIVSTSEDIQVEFEGDVYALGPYPNPVRETATFELTARETQSVTVEVFNALGQRMYSEDRTVDAEVPTRVRIDAGTWGSGLYVLRVQGEGGITETQNMLVVR